MEYVFCKIFIQKIFHMVRFFNGFFKRKKTIIRAKYNFQPQQQKRAFLRFFVKTTTNSNTGFYQSKKILYLSFKLIRN